jgi:hypothetical protein
MAHESMVEEWQPCKRFMEEVQEPDNEPKRGPWSRSEIAFREYGRRPDVEDEVGFSLREGFRSDYFRRVTMYSKHGLVHKYQEAPKSAGLKMFELFTEFIKEDKLAPDETREQFYYVNLSHVKNPCQGKKTKSSEATVALETWTQAVSGSEPTIGCITPEAAATLVQDFMANSKWIHRAVSVHGDQHVGNYHWGVKPDGTLTLKAFDFGHAFSASTHGDLSKFAEETRLYVSFFVALPFYGCCFLLFFFKIGGRPALYSRKRSVSLQAAGAPLHGRPPTQVGARLPKERT